ncbi:hypothetical protein [Arthrobacter sp. JCM 19049]|uniref:hypothetical protein n=1 Tax=Arthrobacter sp. JCM 19049 TaxID=1460643 RepID=UPI0035B4FA93
MVLAIPYDLAAAPASQEGPWDLGQYSFDPPAPRLGEEQLQQIAALLNAAQRPHVLYGRGALDAAGPMARLADKLGATSSGTLLARDLLARPADLGITGGFSTEAAAQLIAQADTVLVLGASLNQFQMRFGQLFDPAARVIQIDVAPTATSPRVDVFASADSGQALDQLLPLLQERAGGRRYCDGLDLTAVRARPAGDPVAADGLLDPRRVASELEEILPENRLLVQDGGHFIGWPHVLVHQRHPVAELRGHRLPVHRPGRGFHGRRRPGGRGAHRGAGRRGRRVPDVPFGPGVDRADR